MKILYYSDIHFREKGSFIPWNRQENRFTNELNRILNSMYWLSEIVEVEKPDLLLCLGDIFNNLVIQSSPTLDASGLAFSQLKETCKRLGIEHWLIPGNHDYYGRYNNAIYSIRVLEGFFDRIFYEPVYEDNILYLPYFTDEAKAYEEILLREPKKVITHLTFNGADVGKVKVQGLKPPRDVKVISGHIHIPQKIGNALYVGSLVQLSWIEGTKHGVYIEENGKFKFIQNPVGKQIVKIKRLDEIDKYDIKNTGFILETFQPPEKLPVGVDIQVKLVKEEQKEERIEYEFESFQSPLELLKQEVKEVFPDKVKKLETLLKE